MPEFTDAELEERLEQERERAREETRAAMTAEREASEQWTAIQEVRLELAETKSALTSLAERIPPREEPQSESQGDPQEVVAAEAEASPELVEVPPVPEPAPPKKERPRHLIW